MKKKAFTLVEMVTAIAVLVIIISFASVIFKMSIDSYRTANANMEIMQKLRAISSQLNQDFEGFCKDGYLIIKTELKPLRDIYPNSTDQERVRMDRIYYFTTGDFQSWDTTLLIRSNIARVFMGHDTNSLDDNLIPEPICLSRCKLARDVCLLTPGVKLIDTNSISFAQCRDNLMALEEKDPNDAEGILNVSVSADLSDSDNVRRYMCENIGEFKIEWTWGFDSSGNLVWEPGVTKSIGYTEQWPSQTKPKALKFTFTLYDSKGILKGGRRFTHIVYLDE